MTTRRAIAKRLGWGCCLVCLCIAAYAVSDSDVKAAYILNFAKFVEWPVALRANQSTLALCVANPDALDGKLQQLNGRQANGMTIRVQKIDLTKEWAACQIIFLEAKDIEKQPGLLKSMSKSPILTISDAPEFAFHGGIIGFSLDANRVKFSINLNVAEAAGLRLSSRMLQVANVVYSEPR